MSGEEQPGKEIFWIYPCRGRVGEKIVKIFLAGAGLARKKSKFSSLGPFSSHQNVQVLAKMYQSLAKMPQNEPIPGHGEENIILIPHRAPPARQNLVFRPEEFSQYPAPNRNTPQNAVSAKKRRGLVGTLEKSLEEAEIEVTTSWFCTCTANH